MLGIETDRAAAWLREHWSLVLGAAIIVVGNVYMYVLGDYEWRPPGVPLLIAVGVVVAIEFVRAYLRRSDSGE